MCRARAVVHDCGFTEFPRIEFVEGLIGYKIQISCLVEIVIVYGYASLFNII